MKRLRPVIDVGGGRVPSVRASAGAVAARSWEVLAGADPSRTAVASRSGALSYAELTAAVRAVDAGVSSLSQRGELVGLALPQEPSAVVAMLGVLAAGRAFVPLDPQLPAHRLSEIAKLAGLRLCLTDDQRGQAAVSLRRVIPSMIDLSTLLPSPATAATWPGQRETAVVAGDPAELACVLFTSGSMGVPKGVVYSSWLLQHDAGLGAMVAGISRADIVGVAMPYSFAAGLTASFWALQVGATLSMYDPRVEGAEGVADWVDEHRLTTLHATPSLLRAVATCLRPGRLLPSLRLVTSSGESLYGRDVRAMQSWLSPDAVLLNWVGASEMASLCFHRIALRDEVSDGPVPAGRPVEGKTVRIVDSAGRELPRGTLGELAVTSALLADGYWGRADLTAQRFVALGRGFVKYRSGDRGLLRPDGTLELRGRLDDAIKVRGYLVEPAEVEAALLTCPNIAEAVVVAATAASGGPRLVAYYVAPPGTCDEPSAILRQLRARLPGYMVPASIVRLPALPRNERGKVDRSALPPAEARPLRASLRPMTSWQREVAALWQEVLRVDEVDLGHDFFAIGGDSLHAVALLRATAARLKVTVSSSELLRASTLEEFAAVCAGSRAGPRSGPVPLRSGSSRPPLFCVAGAGGVALELRRLADRLPVSRPVWGLQAHGMESRGLLDWSVDQAARRHIRAIRSIQPTGPYHLLGYSLGGLIAYEMAQQLTAAGETVWSLAILDTYLPQPPGRREVAAQAADRVMRPVGRTLRRLRYVLGIPRMQLAGLAAPKRPDHDELMCRQAFIIGGLYRPRPYDGRVSLYLAEEGAAADQPGWDQLLRGDKTVRHVAGDHPSILQDPAVWAIAATVQADLAAAESSDG